VNGPRDLHDVRAPRGWCIALDRPCATPCVSSGHDSAPSPTPRVPPVGLPTRRSSAPEPHRRVQGSRCVVGDTAGAQPAYSQLPTCVESRCGIG
jgi:hypothetical protein